MAQFYSLEINGGAVKHNDTYLLTNPPTRSGYTNAQLDDYAGKNGRSRFQHQPDCRLELEARFSHAVEQLQGTAGFGFWNAPLGDPTLKRPALPQAVWFFFSAPPNDLPFYQIQPGRGWAASTINAANWQAIRWAPLTPFVLLLNQFSTIKKRLWPRVQADLGVYSALITADATEWHHYALEWGQTGCHFWIDGELILSTSTGPRGPLGFVCWIDNQYMVATGDGRFGWGTVPLGETQTLEIANLTIT